MVAPYVPEWLRRLRTLVRVAPGCYQVEPAAFSLLWIAANELPLRDELLPFLVARSGRALEQFARWAEPRRPVEWMFDMVQYTSMTPEYQEELRKRFGKTDDPDVVARRKDIVRWLVDGTPEVRQMLIEEIGEEITTEARLTEVRALLRRVLNRRNLVPNSDDEARVDACADIATLERWLEQAVTATTVAEALH